MKSYEEILKFAASLIKDGPGILAVRAQGNRLIGQKLVSSVQFRNAALLQCGPLQQRMNRRMKKASLQKAAYGIR